MSAQIGHVSSPSRNDIIFHHDVSGAYAGRSFVVAPTFLPCIYPKSCRHVVFRRPWVRSLNSCGGTIHEMSSYRSAHPFMNTRNACVGSAESIALKSRPCAYLSAVCSSLPTCPSDRYSYCLPFSLFSPIISPRIASAKTIQSCNPTCFYSKPDGLDMWQDFILHRLMTCFLMLRENAPALGGGGTVLRVSTELSKHKMFKVQDTCIFETLHPTPSTLEPRGG